MPQKDRLDALLEHAQDAIDEHGDLLKVLSSTMKPIMRPALL